MTLGGLSLAVGMLVDDATVEVENIHRNRGEGKPLTVAILDGAHQVAVPALAATLTICIVFFPVVMLQGPSRFLFMPLALAVVFSMIASYLLSRTLVPSLAHKLLPENEADEHKEGWVTRFNDWRDRGFDRLRGAYGGVSGDVHRASRQVPARRAALRADRPQPRRRRRLRLLSRSRHRADATARARPDRHAHRGHRGLAWVDIEREIARIIPRDELDTINDKIGIPTYYNLAFVSTDNVGGQDAEMLIQLKAGHHPSQDYMTRIRKELPAKFPGVQLYFMPADVVTQVLNFGVSSMIDVQIEGQRRQCLFRGRAPAVRQNARNPRHRRRAHRASVQSPGAHARRRSAAGAAAQCRLSRRRATAC